MAPEVPNFSGHHNDGPGFLQSTPQHLQSQNPNNNLTNGITFNGDGQHRPKNERAMEKFRQAVMKIAEVSGASTNPTQKNLIEQRLTDFFSNFHTPNHPPYAAMIQKAIQDLNEKGGSSEESISNYIKTEYNDLPWANSTFLKHHLSKLCESGEISLTRKRCYVLPGAKPCARPKRENLKRKQRSRSQSARGRSRGCKKEETVEDDQQNKQKYGEDIEGYIPPFQEERGEMIENENEPDREEVRLVEEQNLALELPNEVIEEQNEVILDLVEQENSAMDLYPVPIQLQQPELSLPEMAEELKQVMIEQISEIEKHEPEPERTKELKQTLVDNEGMEYEPHELQNSQIQGQSQQQTEGSGVIAEWSPQHPPESELALKRALTLPVNLDVLEKEKNEELPYSETLLMAKPEEGNKIQAETEKPDLPIYSERGIVESSIGLRTDDEEQQPGMPTELEQSGKTDRQQRQLKRWRQSLPKVKPPPTSMPSHSQEPNSKRPEELKQTPMENEVIQDDGKSDQQKQENGIGVEQSQSHPLNLDVVKKEHSNPVIPSEVEVTGVKDSFPSLHEIMEDQRSKRQLRSQSRSHISSTFVKQRQPELSSPEKSTELELATISSLPHDERKQADTSGGHEAEVPEPTVEQLSHTDRGQRQLNRWTKSPLPKQAGNSVQTEVTNLERPQEVKENSGEQSTPITVQRAKLRSWQKQNKSQSNMMTSDLALALDQLELQTKLDLPERSAELEPIEESSDAPVGELTRTDNQNPDVRDQPPRRGRGPKPDMPVGELTVTDHQNPCLQDEPARRGRGRPPKQKPDTPVGKLLGTDHQNSREQDEPARNSPVGEPMTGTDHQSPCVQEQPPRRGRGRPKRGRGKP